MELKQSSKTLAIRKELEQIAKANGGMASPEAVVEFAADPNTALHSRFEWDDTAAGHQYRLWQARHILKVQVQFEPRTERRMNVFVSLPADRTEGGGYRRMVDVLSDADRREQLLQSAIAEMEFFQRKYAAIKELADVFTAMRKVKSVATSKAKRTRKTPAI